MRLVCAFELPVLHRHFQRDLHRRGAAVGVKHPMQPLGRDLDQLLRQLNARHMAQAKKRRMGDAIELRFDRVVNFLLAMAMHVAPQRRHPVEILAPVDIDKIMAIALADDQGSSPIQSCICVNGCQR